MMGNRTKDEMQPFWDRLHWNVKHLFSKDLNPYVLHGEGDLLPKERTAIEDIGHSIKNIWIEWKKPVDER